ncbi:MAG: hypothetical protein ACJ780_24790, partial [Solirubrobacteraceae bacterium]
PSVSMGQEIVLAVALAFVGWAAWQLVRRRPGWFTFFVIAAVAIWEGASLIAVLVDGFVLIALPPFVARVAVVTCLSAGVSLLPVVFALAERTGRGRAGRPDTVVTAALAVLAVAGCGSAASPQPAPDAVPAALAAQARPIGHGGAFHPPARGPVPGPCRAHLGPRSGAHVELFAADRVVLVAAGLGVRGPVTRTGGRISAARCYGALATLEPTGVVLVRAGTRATVADLFRAWGRPLTARRMLSFSGRVRVYVDGRPRTVPPGAVVLRRHSEIVLEVGPRVPPHLTYRFPPGA